jgi:SAM-dependent methyltransferase
LITAAKTTPLALVLEDLAIRAERVRTVGDTPSAAKADPGAALAAVSARERDAEAGAAEAAAFAAPELAAGGSLLLELEGERDERELARWRNALWPAAHVGAIYRLAHTGILRTTLAGTAKLRGATGVRGLLLVGRAREHVLAPDATVAKFDQNAAGWDGKPGSPGYAHFRWMRRFVGTFAGLEWMHASARRILDFGCGAGWVGIEAALAAGGAELAAFDPSPEMVRITEENARASGVARCTARIGFGEAPPFPAPSEDPFPLVISSGVISFAPEPERWLDGLARTVARGGKLVIGDIHRESRGMKRRRANKALLPAREMNARTRGEVRASLEKRGFVFEAEAGYQLTYPVPELAWWSETKLGGALNPALLWWNRTRAGGGAESADRFDSWVLRMRRD